MEGEEVKLCQNQTVSFILEELLLLASPSQIGRFLDNALEGFEVILADRFAGHVVQRALFQAVKCFDDEGEGAELQEKGKLEKKNSTTTAFSSMLFSHCGECAYKWKYLTIPQASQHVP